MSSSKLATILTTGSTNTMRIDQRNRNCDFRVTCGLIVNIASGTIPEGAGPGSLVEWDDNNVSGTGASITVGISKAMTNAQGTIEDDQASVKITDAGDSKTAVNGIYPITSMNTSACPPARTAATVSLEPGTAVTVSYDVAQRSIDKDYITES